MNYTLESIRAISSRASASQSRHRAAQSQHIARAKATMPTWVKPDAKQQSRSKQNAIYLLHLQIQGTDTFMTWKSAGAHRKY